MLEAFRRRISFIALFCLFSCGASVHQYGTPGKTLYVAEETLSNPSKVTVINRFTEDHSSHLERRKRDAATSMTPALQKNITTWTTHLNDSHQQLMVHWVGEGSNVIICLARDSSPKNKGGLSSSALFISYDYGKNFTNKTENFKLDDTPNSGYAQLDKFFNHPKYPEFCVFVDSTNKKLYYTFDNGRTIHRSDLNFHPSELAFDEELPEKYVVLDKVDSNRKLYLTLDGGYSFVLIQTYVKTFVWSSGPGFSKVFFVERWKPDGTSTVFSVGDPAHLINANILFEDAKDFQIKGDYMFATKQSKEGNHGANLLRHFFTQHRAKYDEIQNSNMTNKENMPPQTSDNTKTVIDCCTKLVTVHGRPFNIVEDEAFKQIVMLIPGMNQKEKHAINIKNVKANISDKAYEVRLQISKELKNNLLALKVDVASVKLRRFLGLNVQYILNGKIILRNLSVVELHDRNTGDYLKENVATSLSRFGIELSQILTITTDNGANMLRMTNEINDSANESFYEEPEVMADEEIENLELEVQETGPTVRKVTSVRCAAHCLQLAVKDACREIQDFLEQCRQLVRHLRTPNMSLKLKEQKLPQAVLDTAVRWDSTADMVESIKKLKTFCIENMNLSAEAEIWTTLDKYLEILQPCRFLSKELQKEQLTFGDFYLSWMRCRHQVAQINDPFAHRLQSCLQGRQEALFENDQFLAATYLDLRVNSILTDDQATRGRLYLTDIYKRIVRLNKPIEQESSSSELGTSRQAIPNFDDFLRQQFINNNGSRGTGEFSLEREINFKLMAFLQEPILSPDCNILEFWEGKKFTDPYLFNLAKVVLAAPPTSVSVERLFSSLKFVLNNLRMSLNDSIIEDVMVIRNNHLYSKN